ncbi:MAG: hypothetical protein WC723_06880 [Candidatus Omnitrophota bacterium]
MKYKKLIDNFIQILKNTYKDSLISVTLYGSAASGEFSARHSNINLMVILDNASLENLSRMLKITSGHRFRALSPVFFTEEYLRESTDVFPIEFLDMKENYSLLYGRDVLKDLEIDSKNLRFQCEQELKAKIISIKKFYLANRSRPALEAGLFKSFNSSLHVLRNLIRLKGKAPPYLKEDVLKELGREFQIDTQALNKILVAKSKNLRLSSGQIEGLFFSFVKQLEEIVDIIDRL